MDNTAKIVSLVTLAFVIIPSLLFCLSVIGLDTVKTLALVGTIGWFIATPLWMGRELSVDASEVEI